MAEFQVVWGRKDQPKEQWSVHHDPLSGVDKWGNPQEANEICKKLNTSFKQHALANHAAMLKRLPDPVDYLAREANRAAYNPFEVQGEEFHCAELRNDGNIYYFATIYDAYDDRRSNMKLGRYLRKYTEKTDNEISDICARYGYEFGDAVVHFAKTREEIRNVYENGPRSCMGGKDADCFGLPFHPAEIYASGDFEVAYLKRDDRITARTVVVPSKKIYICIYGDSTRMHPALEALGYSRDTWNSEDLDGLKVLYLKSGNRVAMPFTDWDCHFKPIEGDADHLVCSRYGDYYGCEEGYNYEGGGSPYDDDGYEGYDDDY